MSPATNPLGGSVAVVGGGLAGLAAACALSGAGFRVRLFERRPFLGAVVAPVDGFVQHLGEERGVGVRAEPEHRRSLG